MKHVMVMLAILTSVGALAQQPDPEQPWAQWQPPEVVLPQPNGFDTYLAAFDLKARLDRELGLDQGPPPALPDAPPDRWHIGPPDLPPPERVALYAEVLQLVRTALAQETVFPSIADINQTMPYLAEFRTMLRLLVLEAEARRVEGDFRAAAASALDGLEVAQDVKRRRILISGLVGVACEAIAFASLDETIPELSGPECREVLAQLLEIEKTRVPVAEWLAGEEILTRSYFKQIALDPAKQEEIARALAEAVDPAPDAAQVVADLGPEGWAEIGQAYAAMREYVTLPWLQRPVEPLMPNNFLMQTLARSIVRIAFNADRATTVFRLHEAELAARAHVLEHERLPESLQALVPEYLPAVPDDPFGAAPLRSILKDAALIIYSVGPDGVDDGGQRHSDQFLAPKSKGDVIIRVPAGQ